MHADSKRPYLRSRWDRTNDYHEHENRHEGEKS